MQELYQILAQRLPLAEATEQVLHWALDEEFLARLFDQHRGTGSEQKVTFALLVSLVGEAIVVHQGSARRCMHEARAEGRFLPTEGAVYGKLRRLPPELSQAFVRETAQRLRALAPPSCEEVPPSLRTFQVLIVDGKKLKQLPKRLKAVQNVRGKLLGGKVVVGLLLNEGLIVAMEATLDGEANDAPLTPGLLDQCQQAITGPRLIVADRQFCDLKIPHHILASGDSFVIRYSKKMRFSPEKEQVLYDAQAREVREAWGWLGSNRDPRRLYVRQITLVRPDEEPVILVTNLLAAEQFPATEMLAVYLARWNIERVFQQLTEVFDLRRFIGSTPHGAVFQFAFCALLYNVLHVLRVAVANERKQPANTLSSEMMFHDVCRELSALTLLVPRDHWANFFSPPRSLAELRARLGPLVNSKWSDLWIKCPTHPKRQRPPPRTFAGNHPSAWKLILAYKRQQVPR